MRADKRNCILSICIPSIVIELSTCGARGKEGPKSADCVESYNNTDAANSIRVIEDQLFKGVQVWRVPRENYYT